MKRILLPLLATFLAASVFAAPVTLKVPVPKDTPENKSRIQAEMEKIARFEAANPGIVCQAINFDYDNTGDFLVKQAAQQAPDVFQPWATEAQMLVSKKWIIPLDSYIGTWDKKDWYNKDAYLPYVVGGVRYGVPDQNYIKHVLYNKQMFQAKGVPTPAADWTWDDFVKAAVKLTDKASGVAGFAPMGKGAESGWGFTDFIYQAGGEVERMENGKAYAAFDSEEAIAAAKLFKDLKWKYDAIPANWSNGWGDVFNVFGSKQTAMVLDADWGRNIIVNNFKMDPKNIGLALMPKGPGPKGRHAGVLGGTFFVINGLAKGKAVQDAAWKWITFERWDDAALGLVKSQIEDSRANHQYRAQFQYSPLLPGSPYVVKERALLEGNPDAAVAWGDAAFLAALPRTAHTEPPVAAQDVYGKYLANVVQTLFTDQSVDPAALMRDTARRFQAEILDPLNAKVK
ncbi:MAG: ABC transporter substrate-binding protein [Spirochaetia bacterium]